MMGTDPRHTLPLVVVRITRRTCTGLKGTLTQTAHAHLECRKNESGSPDQSVHYSDTGV